MIFKRIYKAVQGGTGSGEKDQSRLTVHIPVEWAREQGIYKGQELEVEVNGPKLIIRKVKR